MSDCRQSYKSPHKTKLASLTPAMLRRMKEMRDDGYKMREISERYGIRSYDISRLLRGM